MGYAPSRRVSKYYTNHQDHSKDFSHRYLYHEKNIVAILDEKRLADNKSLLSVASEPKRSEQNIAVQEALLATILHHPTQTDTPLGITNELTGETLHLPHKPPRKHHSPKQRSRRSGRVFYLVTPEKPNNLPKKGTLKVI